MTDPPDRSHVAEGAGLTAMAAAAAALVSGVGALTLTGALGRVQRNQGTLFAIAVGCVAIGAGLWVAGSLISPRARKFTRFGRNIGPRSATQALAVAFSLVGLVVGFAVAVSTANDTEQPTVSLALGRHLETVAASAKVGNLSSEDRLTVYVDGLKSSAGGGYDSSHLYQTFVGPDGDGDASAEIKVGLPRGRFNAVGIQAFTAEQPEGCGRYPRRSGGDDEAGTGCAILQLPARTAAPHLAVSWAEREGSVASLRVRLKANLSNTPHNHQVLLRVTGEGGEGTDSLYQATILPPVGRMIRRKVLLPLDPALETVCAEARVMPQSHDPPDPSCPLGARPEAAAVQLRVPEGGG